MALGHLVVLVAHDRRAVDILRDLPAEALVEEVIFRCRRQILRPAHDVRDAHEMVVDDVCEVIRRQTVALDEHLIVERVVVDRDVAEDLVMERGLSLARDLLADDIGLAGREICRDLLLAQTRAAAVIFVDDRAVGNTFFCSVVLIAEAAVGMAARDEQLGIFLIEPAPLGLDVRADRTADIRPLVVRQAAGTHGAVDDVDRALHIAPLIGVLDAQDELAAGVPRDQIRIKRRAQIADVHIPRRARREPRAHLSVRDAQLHVFKPLLIFHILIASGSLCSDYLYLILHHRDCQGNFRCCIPQQVVVQYSNKCEFSAR